MNSSAKRFLLPLGAGLLGAVFLTGVYLGIVSLAESPKHALELFWQDKAFVIPIILGFGTQVGLYTVLKKGLHMPMRVPAAGATTAAGGGLSTMAMVACCAHHVADVLPLVGLTAAAAFLANWFSNRQKWHRLSNAPDAKRPPKNYVRAQSNSDQTLCLLRRLRPVFTHGRALA